VARVKQAQSALRAEAVVAGMLGLLHKPYQIGALLQLVDEAVRHPRISKYRL
jgi:hypothetical protein